ncbi:MAG: homogentisate phytyltransferase [Saprospiraceae bacterium]
MLSFLRNFVHFVRLHTVIGTTLSILALYWIALSYANGADLHLDLLAWTLLGCLGANVFIVGLNQITDVAIDKINKPYLPLASGAFSMQTGYLLVGIGIAISLAIAIWLGGYLLWTVVLSLILGIAYSLPPIRLKRFTFWAAFCIIAVRGLIVNLLLFLHFHANINGEHQITPLVWLLTATIFVYSLIIAWFKDMPDTEGDDVYQIKTLSLRIGRQRVFNIGNIVLSLLFLSLAIIPFVSPIVGFFFSFVHLFFLLTLWWRIRRVDLQLPASIFKYYQFVWILFFLEYAIFSISVTG